MIRDYLVIGSLTEPQSVELDLGADAWADGETLDGSEPPLVELGYRLMVLDDQADVLGDVYMDGDSWTFDVFELSPAQALLAEIQRLGLPARLTQSDSHL